MSLQDDYEELQARFEHSRVQRAEERKNFNRLLNLLVGVAILVALLEITVVLIVVFNLH